MIFVARIIARIKSKYWIRMHKNGIQIPKSAKETLEIDNRNGNTLWWDALMKAMKNVKPAFEINEGRVDDLIGYQKIKCHIVWDIKLCENFRRKARLVASRHTTDTQSSITYSFFVSRDSVRIELTLAALNDLKILAYGIQNAYLIANCREKIYTIAGPEFDSEAGCMMIVRKAIYGLKSSGAAFRAHIAYTIRNLGYSPSKVDPDVWLKLAVKPDGSEYFEMVLVYIDDVISICWALSLDKYVKTAVSNVEDKLAESQLQLPSKCITLFRSANHSSEDASRELDADGTRHYQELIGILSWAIELGRVDNLLEVSLLSSHQVLPRIRYLQQV